MTKKCVFFDADGTILDIEKGVPADVKPAIRQLIQNGHLAFLCTGRSRAYIPKEVEELGLTGMITNLGAYMEYQGKCILNREISTQDAKRAVEILRNCGMVPVLEGAEYMYYDLDEYTTDVDWFADLITRDVGARRLPIRGNESNLHISKISAKKMPGCFPQKACQELEPIFDSIRHEGNFVGKTIEFITKGCSKGLAICVICAVLGIDMRDTIAFGDSNNDLAMFQVVHTKIAIGNGSSELIRQADYVTDPLEKGGIPKALRHLGLIS